MKDGILSKQAIDALIQNNQVMSTDGPITAPAVSI